MEIRLSTANSDILVSFSRLKYTTFEETLSRFKRALPDPHCFRWDSDKRTWRLHNRYAPYLLKSLSTTMGDDINSYQTPLL